MLVMHRTTITLLNINFVMFQVQVDRATKILYATHCDIQCPVLQLQISIKPHHMCGIRGGIHALFNSANMSGIKL